jgi:phosphoribosylformylglycinamidine cyclo-ligase
MIDEHGIIDGNNDVKEGNHILALESNGAHTNGYSLIRKIFEISKPPKNILKDACKIHKCYYKDVKKIRDENIKINALCHITGGGLIDNPVRVLPSHLGINFYKNTWKLPNLFQYIQDTGNIDDTEMYKTFNCGIGLLIIVSPNISKQIIDLFPENYCFQIGEVIKSNSEKRINFIHLN